MMMVLLLLLLLLLLLVLVLLLWGGQLKLPLGFMNIIGKEKEKKNVGRGFKMDDDELRGDQLKL